MSLNWIRACWQCDTCGKDFVVEIDSGWTPPKEWGLDDIAKDAVRHGHLAPVNGKPLIGDSSSVQHGLVLCGECTNIVDKIGPEDHEPSRHEILSELGVHNL